MKAAPRVLGAILAVGLLAAVVLLGDDARAGPPVVIGSGTPAGDIARAVANVGDAPIVYRSDAPPSRAVTALLEGASARGSVSIEVPVHLPPLVVQPPVRPVAMRAAALRISLRGPAGGTVPFIVEDAAGGVDSLTAVLDERGFARVDVRVHPLRGGVGTWSVRTDEAVETATTWIAPPRAVRVLVVAGPPDWETRFLLRALEEKGAVVRVHQTLGRDKEITSADVDVPATVDDLGDYDVVVVSAWPEAVGLADLLDRWVVQRGGGLLIAARSGDSTGMTELNWSGPVEIEPLPAVPSEIDAWAVPVPTNGVPVARRAALASAVAPGSENASPPDEVVMSAGTRGRGRIIRVGIETWRWRMQSGEREAHADFWLSAAHWLAGGLRFEWELHGPVGSAGLVWSGVLEGNAPAGLALVSPDGTVGSVRVDPFLPGIAQATLLPTEAGGYAIEGEEGRGFAIVPADVPTRWPEAVLALGGAGARVVPRSAADGNRTVPPFGPPYLRWLAFFVLASAAAGRWAIRRVTGLP